MRKVVQNVSELDFFIHDLEKMPVSQKVMLVSPEYFDVLRSINVHMRKADGSLQSIDKKKALSEWKSLKKAYEKLKFEVFVVDAVQGLPDFVFSANQCFPFLDKEGHPHAVLSNMHDDTRNSEVSYINKFLISQGYKTHKLPPREQGYFFEGMGDVLWLPGVRFILGGFGFRTDQKVYTHLSELTDAPVAIFELKNPRFYHLDTCLSILNSKAALVCKDAFTEEGFALLKQIFSVLIEVPIFEADSPGFACNAHCPDGKHVILQTGNPETERQLKEHNFIPLPLETSEFIKSGGSVFCLKLMFF